MAGAAGMVVAAGALNSRRASRAWYDEPAVHRRTCKLLSVVVTCFNEEDALPAMHRRLVGVLEAALGPAFELVYVDDGSRDATLDVLREYQQADPRVRVVALSRNFGQPIALVAGLQNTAGQAVLVMDADLQHPPEAIPDMLDRWRKGVDVVYGVRKKPVGVMFFKRAMSKVFYRLLGRLVADIDIPHDTGEFRLMDRAVVDGLVAMPERDRFNRGMVAWIGLRQEPFFYNQAPRVAGDTKWPLRKLLSYAVDAILSFSFTPLRLATWAGCACAGLALAGIACTVVLQASAGLRGTALGTVLIALLFWAGVQFVFIGILGEYVGRIYAEVKRRPLYLIKERRGFPADDASEEAPEPVGGSASLRPPRFEYMERVENPPR